MKNEQLCYFFKEYYKFNSILLYFYNNFQLMTFCNEKYNEICNNILTFSSINDKIIPKIIAVSKNQSISSIIEAIEFGVRFFAENKVQEALLKFNNLKKKFNNLELHMTGSIQTNKVKKSLEIFDYFHTLDREKIANEFHKQISHSDKFNKKNFLYKLIQEKNIRNPESLKVV